MVLYDVLFHWDVGPTTVHHQAYYRSDIANFKSFVGKDFLLNKWKYELNYALSFEFNQQIRIRNYFGLLLYLIYSLICGFFDSTF